MNMDGHDVLVARINQYMQETGISARELAKLLNIASSTLSQWRSGTYSSPENIDKLIERFFEREERRERLLQDSSYRAISTSETVLSGIEYCHLRRKLGVIVGDAGTGKTQGATEYVRRNPGSLLLTVTPANNRESGVLRLIGKAVNLPRSHRRDEDFDLITDRLYGRDIVLILDESQHLNVAALEILRSLHDATQIGLVLIGNHEVVAKLNGNNKAAFAQLFSRIAYQIHLTTKDVLQEDIELLWPEMESSAHRSLLKLARSPWGIRGAANIADQARLLGATDADSIRRLSQQHGIII